MKTHASDRYTRETLAPLPETPFITVVIPVYNEERYIAQCLESVVGQEYPTSRLQVLVIDGGSTDRTREVVSRFRDRYPFIQLLENPRKIVSTAMNIGIRHAHPHSDIIARVDGHCVLAPDYLKMCTLFLKKTGAYNVGGNMRPIGDGYISNAIAITMQSPLAVGDAKFRYAQQEQPVDTVYLGAFRREVFEEIGLYNENLVRNQDYELNYRIRSAGGQVFLAPAIRSWYIARPSLTSLAAQYFQYGFWKTEMLRRYPASIRWRQLVPPTFVASLILTGLGSLFAPPLALLFRTIVGAYALLAGAFTLHTARRHGWRYLPILPITFATMHLSWGLGFLWGLVRRPTPPAQSVPTTANSVVATPEESVAEEGATGS